MGPVGYLKYLGHGKIWCAGKDLPTKNTIFLVLGGTGITPGLSIAQAGINGKDDVKFHLVWSNKTKKDLFCQSEINLLEGDPNFTEITQSID